jgi:hypothetical protein
MSDNSPRFQFRVWNLGQSIVPVAGHKSTCIPVTFTIGFEPELRMWMDGYRYQLHNHPNAYDNSDFQMFNVPRNRITSVPTVTAWHARIVIFCHIFWKGGIKKARKKIVFSKIVAFQFWHGVCIREF